MKVFFSEECLIFNYKHWNSAYLRQGTSYQRRDPDPHPDPWSGWIRIVTKIYRFCSLAHCQPSLKFSCKSVQKFLHKVANRQTDKQRRLHILLGGGKNQFRIHDSGCYKRLKSIA